MSASMLAGWASALFSLTIAAAVTWGIIKPEFTPREDALRRIALERGYEIAGGSLTIGANQGMQEWRFVALALSKKSGAPLPDLAAELNAFEGIVSFQIAHARN